MRADATARLRLPPSPTAGDYRSQLADLPDAKLWRINHQLGALGLVLNCITLWNTVYLDAALARLRDEGYPVRDEDMARLSPFVSKHLGVHGTYSFVLPDLAPGAIRELRDPDNPDDE